jgi:hypothetical protein
VGCGNSGMEVCLDLCNYSAKPSLVVRDTVSILILIKHRHPPPPSLSTTL